MLTVLVLGAGAVGCFIGGLLATAGHQVTLIGRPPVMEPIARAGLKLTWPDRPLQTAALATAVGLDRVKGPFDFIFLTVKAPATATALAQLATMQPALANTPAFLVSLQNGIGNEEQAAAVFGPEKVIAGTLTIPVMMPEPGEVVVSKTTGGCGLAPLHPGQPVERLAEALRQAGLVTALYADYRAMKWSKLLLNMVTNASSAILNEPPAQIIGRPELFNLEIEALREATAVMKAQRIRPVRLPGYRVDWLARLVAARWLPFPASRAILRPFMLSGRGTKMPSLQQDLAAGRSSSEVSVLNGAVAWAGRRSGVATPVNQTLNGLLNRLASGELAWQNYQQQPEQLLQAVAAARRQDTKKFSLSGRD